MSRNLAFAVLLLVLAAGQASCGQKGPLYLPSPESEQTQEKR
ncbi:LPS translocon maturation chaperone LptM [Methylothermus subterraneus]